MIYEYVSLNSMIIIYLKKVGSVFSFTVSLFHQAQRTGRRTLRALERGCRNQMLTAVHRFVRHGARSYSTAGAEVTKVGVIGLGLMGHGIAQATAEKGYEVVAIELEDRFLSSGLKRVEDSVTK